VFGIVAKIRLSLFIFQLNKMERRSLTMTCLPHRWELSVVRHTHWGKIMFRFSAYIEVGLFGGIEPALKVGGFWLSSVSGPVDKSLWRKGEMIEVEAYPDDQFCREVKSEEEQDE
jgi:hypothetical protein